MRSIKGSLTGLVLAGILAMMPAAAFAHGSGGGGHGFGEGGGHGFGGGRGDHGRFGAALAASLPITAQAFRHGSRL